MIHTNNLKLFVAAQERKLQAKLDAEAALGRSEPIRRHQSDFHLQGSQNERDSKAVLQRRFKPVNDGRHHLSPLHYELTPRF